MVNYFQNGNSLNVWLMGGSWKTYQIKKFGISEYLCMFTFFWCLRFVNTRKM